GIAFSKYAELFLLRAIRENVDYTFRIPLDAVKLTAIVYALIFCLISLKSLISVSRTDALSLLKAESFGEKPPKGNILLALAGLVILAIAYYLAVSIKQPLTAIMMFFLAVLLVIIASYLLFISGSVTLCSLLKKNKKYYYNKKNFVSVSSMAYRMKRNGAGLASICVLSSLILGGFVSTACLYFGSEDTIDSRYPYDTSFSVDIYNLDKTDYAIDELEERCFVPLRAELEKSFDKRGITPTKSEQVSYSCIYGMLSEGGEVTYDSSRLVGDQSSSELERLAGFYFISLKSFNEITGRSDSLEKGDAIICPLSGDYKYTSFSLDKLHLNISSKYFGFPRIGEIGIDNIVRAYVVVLPELETLRPILGIKDSMGENALRLSWDYGYDIEGTPAEKLSIYDEQRAFYKIKFLDDLAHGFSIVSKDAEKADYYSVYGGLFFIGILLSLIFICATVLIIYYKQVSEGYEDAPRFEIMQKIGMTKEDIRKNVNSQMVTVFFAPLLMAGVHLCFAFPMVWKCLQLFYFTNLRLMIETALIAYLVFAVFYTVVYKLTTRKYISIVS
ncbi:MAG: ABC transporter permease, partial [Oscillospiraceae bacterium]|nr:ABC transporter permease [Oscillospiraceae bacterium]